MNRKLISFIKLLCIVYLVVIIPRIIFDKSKKKITIVNKSNYLASIENLLKNKRSFAALKRYDLALITDLQEAENTSRLLKGGLNIKKVFVLNETGKALNNFSQIKKMKVPAFQLNNSSRVEFENQFKNVNGIIFNIRNSGIRDDYCFNTLFKAMSYAQSNNKKLIILDQPNPLSRFIDGPGVIPMQHGLTVAELAKYFNNYVLERPANIAVIAMIGWQRSNDIKDSLNLYQENLLTLLNYIKPINSEVGKELSSKSILLSKGILSNWETDFLKKILNKLGFYCKNYSYYNKKKNEHFNGIKINFKNDLKKFSSFNSMLTLVRFFNNRKNIKLEYSDSFDKMLGSSDTKDFFRNKMSFKELKNNVENSLKDFYFKSKKILLYKPCPLINDIKIIKS